MTKVAAKEFGKHQIRVNSIHPGVVDTDMLIDNDKDLTSKMVQSSPLGRMSTPDDIANAVLFLGGQASTWITGEEFVVDGGLHG